MKKQDVIDRIGQLRNKANLSARELSLRIGKNSAYISRLESKSDSFEPSISALLDIIEACGSTEAEFFYPNMAKYKDDMKFVELFKGIRDEKRKLVIDLLETLKST